VLHSFELSNDVFGWGHQLTAGRPTKSAKLLVKIATFTPCSHNIAYLGHVLVEPRHDRQTYIQGIIANGQR